MVKCGWLRVAAALVLAVTAGCGPQDSEGPQAGEGSQAGAEAQRLTAGKVYTLTGVQSGRCVEIAGSSTANVAAAQLYDCTGAKNQQFRFDTVGGGYYAIYAVGSDKCLDVKGGSTAAGASIIQYTCHGGTNQQWSTADLGNGVVRVTSRSSGMALDAYGAQTANGTKIIQWPNNGGTNQQFKLTEAGSAVTNYTLTVAANGNGTTDPAAGTHSYAAGTSVKITATPASGYTFTGWSGAATGTTNPVTITMDGNKTLTANFDAAAANYTLGITVSGNGTTDPAAGTHSYAAGTSVKITATPASGYTFTGWSGATTGTTNPVTITMDGNKTLTANFDAAAASIASDCVDYINSLRATNGLPALARWAEAESCADGEAKSDSETGQAHGAFGTCGEYAQDECPGWSALTGSRGIVPGCLDMMWAEGPGGGHYDIMTSTRYTKVACGFYTTPSGSVWSVQNFK